MQMQIRMQTVRQCLTAGVIPVEFLVPCIMYLKVSQSPAAIQAFGADMFYPVGYSSTTL